MLFNYALIEIISGEEVVMSSNKSMSANMVE
jgi:hypothetical protein